MFKKIGVIFLSVVVCLCIFPLQSNALDNSNFEYTVNNDEITVSSYTGNDTNVVIPETIDGLPVTTISKDFYCKNTTEIDSLYIPKSIKKIDNGFFSLISGCFIKLRVNEFIVDFENEYFTAYDGALYTANYGKLLKCPSNKKTIVIHENTNSLNNSCFLNTDFETITIPKNIQNIYADYGMGIFEGCNHLKEINVDASNAYLKSINGVLYKDTTLIAYPPAKEVETFTVPNNITQLYDFSFQNNKYIKNIELPESLTSIGYSAFFNCTNLDTINIPSQISNLNETSYEYYLGDYVFEGCINLQHVSVSEDNQTYTSDQNALYTKDYKGLIHWLGRNQTNVILDERVNWIGQYAFKGCVNLESIDIQNVNAIGYAAFYDCINLKKFFFYNIEHFTMDTVFVNNDQLNEFIIPENQGLPYFPSRLKEKTFYVYKDSPAYNMI